MKNIFKVLTGLFCFVLVSTLISATGFAEAATPVTVDITSYQRMGQQQDASLLAELCGFVHNQTGPTAVQITVDVNTHNPGYYHTTTGTTGNFCQLVRTFGGNAQAEILSLAVKSTESSLIQGARK